MRIDRRGFLAYGAAAFASQRLLFAQQPGQLALRIYGLCALVGAEGKPVTVLMPDPLNLNLQVQHQARLITLPSNVAESSDPPLTFLDPIELRQYAFWELKGYKVEITSASTSGISHHRGRKPRKPSDTLPNADTDGDVSWIPDAARFTGAASTAVKTEYLENDPDQKIAARIVIPDGDLAAVFPKRPIDYSKVSFRVDIPGAPVQQALADGVITRSMPGGKTTFTLTPLHGSLPPKTITISARSAGPTEVILSNAAVAHPCTATSLTVLDHFSVYYKLLATPPSPEHVPQWAGGLKLACVSSDEFVRCPPMRY